MCRITLTVGNIEVTYRAEACDGNCHRRAKWLLTHAASVALAVDVDMDSNEPSSSTPLGFTASMDLDPERNVQEDLSEWFEESP